MEVINSVIQRRIENTEKENDEKTSL